MDPGGPPEGAPSDPLDIPGIDKVVDVTENWHSEHNTPPPISDQPRKVNNNRLLFLTVEYVEDNSKDYSRIFPTYEQVPFSPQASSPLSDFEHRVSPLDPNMSSAARYSPTPVQLPPSPFHNSVVVLQGPSSPLISTSDQNVRPTINYVTQLADQSATQTVVQADTASDFVVAGNDEGLDAGVSGELILMQGAAPELESSTAPLMLTGIPSADFALARDFLVTHEEQLNAMSGYKNQNLDIEETKIAHLEVKVGDDSQLAMHPQESPIGPVLPDFNKDNVLKTSADQKGVRRSKRQISDKKALWCKKCDVGFVDADNCTLHNVQTIADQPVPSRARATLPGSYLTINKLPTSSTVQGGPVYGVFAKRNIPRRTQFGPIEGILCTYDGIIPQNTLPLLYQTDDGEFLKIDVSDENASNWMRFVRPASTYKEQNLVISQQGEGIVFLTVRNILPKEELKAGPSIEYASSRNLSILIPDSKDEIELNNERNPWPCFECNQRFLTSEKLQKHLNVHDGPRIDVKPRNKCKKIHTSSKKLFKIVDGQTVLYTCPYCSKVFPRSYSLKRHLLIHPGAKAPRYECRICSENFLHPYNRSRHIKIFHSGNSNEKENKKQNMSEWKCLNCNLIFAKAVLLDLHTLIHNPNNVKNERHPTSCPQCGSEFEKQNELIKHVAEHGRQQAQNTTKQTPLAAYKCSMCYKRFATKVRLQQHSLVHGADDKKPLPCNVCLKRFMNNSALSCHLKTHREDKQIFECPMCRQSFDQVLMLKDHIETHRTEDGIFNCPHCPKSFTKYSVIRKHIRAHHCERKHKCQFCAKRFPTLDKLRMHLLRHSDHREFHCANCDKQFKRKDKLKEHMTRMHNAERESQQQMAQGQQAKKFVPKPNYILSQVNPTDYNRFVYKCHQCLVGFKRRGMLVNHLAKRHPDVPPESVPELNLPILRQTRDYYCQYCEKVYKSSSKRKAHIVKNHPGAALPPSNRRKESDAPGVPNPTFSQTVGSITTTPQGCQWCHKQYASKAKLLQHQRKKHPTLMEPAFQVPRPRNRHTQSQNLDSTITDNNFLMSDYIQAYDIDTDFLKPKVIKLVEGVDLIGNGLDMVGQQFLRMRDIR
ncbi:PR domain zinc finger protein 10-like isoform X1 [Neodiprion fabricii]|uniref:PR domain zinc finger protein 10-like isoform X1 n=1 Tax=Neodiprion fabricii TaxID=2872261 RepID=UPI001ED9423C|nr:PR domain zinc finger protein 10-like isoform X1 [Neodiprion fabricii]XP_046418987.1 PR domain zinc finger protein 10-like isoform X1 [Neodiprion fabricii]XP_046418988.1 PR domain zinc finger protein 10-like isoform X1 [Neodiprion fabricii]XP_046418989.1 PR domain zinc finger protein 10-like isoform X1 [Neodiprion fabricii]